METDIEPIKKQGVKNVIVTLGGNGSFVSMQNNTILHIDSKNVKAIDTTAAGAYEVSFSIIT